MNNLLTLFVTLIQTGLWPIMRFLMWFFGDLKVNGLENIINKFPKEKGIIFAANHTSEFDPFIPSTALPFLSQFSPMFCATREKSFYNESGFRQIFYGGILFRLIGGQQVYGGLKDYEKSLVNHIKLLNSGYADLVFPEGGIPKNNDVKEAKGGIAYLAEKTNSPIVPVGISGLKRVSLSDFFSRKRKIKINFGKPIYQEELKSQVLVQEGDQTLYKKEAKYVMDKINALLV